MTQGQAEYSLVINPITESKDFLNAALVRPVYRDHTEPPEELVRRRWVSASTLALGTFVLAWALRVPPGDPVFYLATLALAATWTVGALLSGRLYLGAARTRSGKQTGLSIVQSLSLGTLLLVVFLAGGALVARDPFLRGPVDALLDHARYGSLAVVALLTAINAIAEEIFFRGALYAAVGGNQAVVATAAVYTFAILPTGIPLLVFAAAVLGVVVGLQRRVTGGVLGPIITHLTWVMGMLFLLPQVLELLS